MEKTVSAPYGQYDDTKLLNIGTNRRSIKPELGISEALGSWILEIAPAITLYTDNYDFFNGNTFAQDPLYSVQGHVVRVLSSGLWFALDCTLYAGGRTSIDGVKQDTWQSNTCTGLTGAWSIDRSNSVKFYTSTGLSTLTGSDFTAIGVAWQYRWGGGF